MPALPSATRQPLPFDHISNLQCQTLPRPSTQPLLPFPPHLLSPFSSAARTTLPGTPPSNPSSPFTHSPAPSFLAPGPNLVVPYPSQQPQYPTPTPPQQIS